MKESDERGSGQAYREAKVTVGNRIVLQCVDAAR